MAQLLKKELLKSVWAVFGAVYAIDIGVYVLPMWLALNLDIGLMV